MILMYVVMIMIMSGHDALTASKWGSAYTEYSQTKKQQVNTEMKYLYEYCAGPSKICRKNEDFKTESKQSILDDFQW